MITDINDPSIGKTVSADVCIAGAGAAGITLAHKLMLSGLNVIVLESGGEGPDPDTEALNKVVVNDSINASLDNLTNESSDPCRLRFFGGTTNHWSGWCRPLDAIDFKARSWVPGSGWPITEDDLVTYYKEAQEYCELDSPLFHASQMPTALEGLPKYSTDKIKSVFWTLSPPTRFGPKYREQLSKAENISVLLNANAVEIITDEGESSVSSLKVRSLKGKEVDITAKKFVLACGAIENAKLLMSSTGRNPNGVGNQSGMVGKNYQTHPHVYTAEIQAVNSESLAELYKRTETPTGNRLRVGVAASEAAQEQAQILNLGATIPRTKLERKGYLRGIWDDVSSGNLPSDFFGKTKKVISDLISSDDDKPHALYMYTEQAPNEESKLVLTDQKDALDTPIVRVQWRLNELDKRTMQVGTELVAEEFGRLNLGRLKVSDWLPKDSNHWPTIWGGCHQIGVTKMSSDPQTGVVDGNCKVHNIDNLYIVGSSVFPTGGHAPPTFTIVALALRLASYINR